MNTIICRDKETEMSIVATNLVLTQHQKYERGEIDLRTFAEAINVNKVKTYVRAERPLIEKQVGTEMFNNIINEVVNEYLSRAFV
ncbi:hypothetical protein [Staphylococcus equorum]|uniref:Uncharacterized protein n=1 Tax=Staphylococcus equorum TaxID=246432 RepID=A0AAP7LV28_9STAP|nr:hypothetical protein [Staphylococcus equorum]OEK58939.1 hypothetical protein ASS94_01030 [Staphylococcus equorum]